MIYKYIVNYIIIYINNNTNMNTSPWNNFRPIEEKKTSSLYFIWNSETQMHEMQKLIWSNEKQMYVLHKYNNYEQEHNYDYDIFSDDKPIKIITNNNQNINN